MMWSLHNLNTFMEDESRTSSTLKIILQNIAEEQKLFFKPVRS
jgi:hypothetical protein